MMNTVDLDNSDTSDEDYVPDTKEDNVSEIDSDGDPEDDLADENETQIKSRKRTKHKGKSRKKQRTTKTEDNQTAVDGSKEVPEENKKKIEDDIWADFMRDTGFQSRKERSVNNTTVNKTSTTSFKTADVNKPRPEERKDEKVKITQTFKFAGEDITIEKEVSKDVLNTSHPETTKNYRSINKNSSSGVSGILSQLGKKSKITTLEKSKLDWDRFKKEENLEEELQTFNKGKDGYLEKQDFLQRADLRRFEIEKEIRTIERNKRMNNV